MEGFGASRRTNRDGNAELGRGSTSSKSLLPLKKRKVNIESDDVTEAPVPAQAQGLQALTRAAQVLTAAERAIAAQQPQE